MKILNTTILAVALTAVAMPAVADSVSGYIQDHYKSVIKQQPHNQQVCSEVYVPNRNTVGPDNMLSGAIIGGIIGNNVTKDLPDGGTAGAIIGGLLGLQNENNQSGSYQTRCSTRTTYTETQQNVYSHSTITFTDSTGTRRSVKFYK